MTEENVTMLRDRLLQLREQCLDRLATAEHMDGGLLALAANAEIVLAAINTATANNEDR